MLFTLVSLALAAPVAVSEVDSSDLPADDTNGLAADRLTDTVWQLTRTTVVSSCSEWKQGDQTQDVVTFVREGGNLVLKAVKGSSWRASVTTSDQVGLLAEGGRFEWVGSLKGDMTKLKGTLAYGFAPEANYYACAAAFEITLKPLK
jgi:hypothetical protein